MTVESPLRMRSTITASGASAPRSRSRAAFLAFGLPLMGQPPSSGNSPTVCWNSLLAMTCSSLGKPSRPSGSETDLRARFKNGQAEVADIIDEARDRYLAGVRGADGQLDKMAET